MMTTTTSRLKRAGAILIPLLACRCLEPLVDDAVLPERIFGPADATPESMEHVEDTRALASKVALFSQRFDYVRGFAETKPVWSWAVDGPNADFVAPIYQVVGPNGPLGRKIIDVLPGDLGYTPWWRLYLVRTTETYAGERIWSRAAIEQGVKLGILEAPQPQTRIIPAPVTLRSTKIQVDAGVFVQPDWGWYRNRRVSWVEFSEGIETPVARNDMPIFPVYVLQRINEAEPLDERMIGRDLTGDADLDDTNDIFASNVGGPRYSPLWYVTLVRTVADYPSIDTSTSTSTVGLTAERQFVGPDDSSTSPLIVPGSLLPMRGHLVNCVIQREKGKL